MTINEPFVRVGEDGMTFQLMTDFTSTNFTSATFHFSKPDGTVVSKVTDNNDGGRGAWGWVVEQGFFDVPGWWMVSLEIDLGSDGTRKSKRPALFLVGGDLE